MVRLITRHLVNNEKNNKNFFAFDIRHQNQMQMILKCLLKFLKSIKRNDNNKKVSESVSKEI